MVNGQAISGLLRALLKKSQVPMYLKKLADISMSVKRQLYDRRQIKFYKLLKSTIEVK